MLPIAAYALRLEPARAFVRAADLLCREGLFGDHEERSAAEGGR